MGFRTYCDNAGCRKEMEPVLDKATDEVFCTECDKVIKTLTSFAKRQMVVLGQVRRAEVKKQAWSVKCESCKKEGPPKLSKPDPKAADKLLCAYCERELSHLNKPFAQTLLMNLKAQRRAGSAS